MFIPTPEYKIILKKIPILCVDLLIIYDDKFLLLERDNEPAKGEYWFPGGRVYKMETIKDAALRKAREEVNLVCDFQYIVSIEETMFKKTAQMYTDVHTVNVVCKLKTDSINELTIDNLHKNYKWISYRDVSKLNLHRAILNPLVIEFGKPIK